MMSDDFQKSLFWLRGDLIETYKIVSKKENIDPNQFFFNSQKLDITLEGTA